VISIVELAELVAGMVPAKDILEVLVDISVALAVVDVAPERVERVVAEDEEALDRELARIA
jgi:hypothetical protein